MLRTAFLIDGAFFLHRYQRLKGNAPPQSVARSLHAMCLHHLRKLGRDKANLYRIFYYDCPPLGKKVHNPVNGQAIDFSKTPAAEWRLKFFAELRKLRKVAVRLGYVAEGTGGWVLKQKPLKQLISGAIAVHQLQPYDVKYDAAQKGVDMKIGLDIASLAYKKQVDQIVLVSGDSDFVSAAKLARREGIDFILDPMWNRIRDDLHEHIDGLQGVFPRPQPVLPVALAAPPATTATVQPEAGEDQSEGPTTELPPNT